jgi:outer membrane protein OmpA-like peptidoglycan-associated protein
MNKIVFVCFFYVFGLLNVYAQTKVPFDFQYKKAQEKSKIKYEIYDKLVIYQKNKGNVSVYGESWRGKFRYNKNKDKANMQKLKEFLAQTIGVDRSNFKKNYIHFFKGNNEYWLSYHIYLTSYEFRLLRIKNYTSIISFEKNISICKGKEFSDFQPNILLPEIKGFCLNLVKFKKYDEVDFIVNKKKKKFKGKSWSATYSKSPKSSYNYRYIVKNDFKEKLIKKGAKIVDEKDNAITLILDNWVIELTAYNSVCYIKIIGQEKFKQSLILSPDKIKSELDKNGKVVLDGIFFDFNKATLKPQSKKAILSVVALMEKYPDLVISVEGHTDSVGDNTYNLTLSQNRAKAVKNAIVSYGIDTSRLKIKGFGEQKPIATNNTEEGRAKNRRVELHKLSGGNKAALVTIDFIKPFPGSVVTFRNTYHNVSESFSYTKPYSNKKFFKVVKGTVERVDYEIRKNGKKDKTVSKNEILKNYENIIELYNGKVIGKYGHSLFFTIDDNGLTLYGVVDGYTGFYSIRLLRTTK